MIAIGGSLGSYDALRLILERLPGHFPHPIAVALHRHRDSDGLLAPTLQTGIALEVLETEDNEPILPGRVYLSPSDYHLMVEKDRFVLSTDELVNFARPSIDVLFESAAEWRGHSLVAIILTGGGVDGARGSQAVHAHGGTVLVQDPQTAEGPWMPGAALAAVPTARVLSLEQIADFLLQPHLLDGEKRLVR